MDGVPRATVCRAGRLMLVLVAVVALPVAWCGGEDGPRAAPDADVPIPEPVVLPVTLRTEPNAPEQPPYVRSQLFAPFPERLVPTVRDRIMGIRELAARVFGIFSGYPPFELSYRRAGAWCTMPNTATAGASSSVIATCMRPAIWRSNHRRWRTCRL